MTDGAPVRPVEKFLGAAASAGGPFALLALSPEDCTQELIIVQLQRQLRRVGAHGEAASHEADEVRLALHAAAAQLLEGIGSESRGGGAASARAVGSSGMSPGVVTMEGDILATIAQCGGWTSQSLHRLALMAHARGVSTEDFLAAIDGFRREPVAWGASGVMSGGAGVASAGVGGVGGAPKGAAADEVDRTPQAIVVGLAVIVAVLGLLGGGIFVVARLTGAPAAPTAGVATSAAGSGAGESGTNAPSPERGRSAELFPSRGAGTSEAVTPAGPVVQDLSALIRDLRGSVDLAASDPKAALSQFLAALAGARGAWTRATGDQITAIQDAVVEFVYRTGGMGEQGRAAVAACVAGVRELPSGAMDGGQVRDAVFSAGLIARLSRERELSGEIADTLSSLLREGFFRTMSIGDASFKGGATSACVEMAHRLTPSDEATGVKRETNTPHAGECWSAWLECVGALGLADAARERLVVQALESLLREAPEPNRRKDVFDAIVTLSASFSWGAGGEVRGRLVRWLEDPEISSADLHAVTMAIVGKGLSAGVDSSMVLSAGAGDAERSNLRDRYREAWGDSAESTRALAAGQLVEAAKGALIQGVAEDPASQLASAAMLSQFSEVAEAVWYGVASPAIPTPPNLSAKASVAGVLYVTAGATHRPGDIDSSAWGVRYLAARTKIPERLVLLSAYAPGEGAALILDAGVIVSEAVRGSPYEIRRAASDVVRANAANAAFVNALLNESATMPLTRDNAMLAGQVSRGSVVSLRNPTFRVVLRRSLVERLLELLSDGEDLAHVDAMSTLMGESYQRRAKRAADAAGRDVSASLARSAEAAEEVTGEDAVPPEGAGAGGKTPVVERSARLLRLALDEEARGHLPSGRELATLEQLRQQRSARLRAAMGRPQQLVAEQVCITELMSYVVVAESPSMAPGVADVLEQYGAARRAAGHVANQIEAGERAMLRLWLLRLKGEGS